jgi:hypothetical protein
VRSSEIAARTGFLGVITVGLAVGVAVQSVHPVPLALGVAAVSYAVGAVLALCLATRLTTVALPGRPAAWIVGLAAVSSAAATLVPRSTWDGPAGGLLMGCLFGGALWSNRRRLGNP